MTGRAIPFAKTGDAEVDRTLAAVKESLEWVTGAQKNAPVLSLLKADATQQDIINQLNRIASRLWAGDAQLVTVPINPAFCAEHQSNEALAADGVISWVVVLDTAGGWDSTNKLYRVPQDGKYLVTCNMTKDSASAASGSGVKLLVNGTNIFRILYTGGVTNYTNGAGSYIVDLKKADTVQLTSEAAVTWFGDSNGLGSFTINKL